MKLYFQQTEKPLQQRCLSKILWFMWDRFNISEITFHRMMQHIFRQKSLQFSHSFLLSHILWLLWKEDYQKNHILRVLWKNHIRWPSFKFWHLWSYFMTRLSPAVFGITFCSVMQQISQTRKSFYYHKSLRRESASAAFPFLLSRTFQSMHLNLHLEL